MKNLNPSQLFIDGIDCNFPLDNERLANYLIIYACNYLESYAVLAILFEILYPGVNTEKNNEFIFRYLDQIKMYWEDPIKDFYLPLAIRKNKFNDYTEDEVLELLDNAIVKNSFEGIKIIEGLYVDYSEKIDKKSSLLLSKLK